MLVPLAGLVSFSSDGMFLVILVGVEAQGRSYGSSVCGAGRKTCYVGNEGSKVENRCENHHLDTAARLEVYV